MKYYHLYMDRQGISRETHGKLLELGENWRPTETQSPTPGKRRWKRWAALAACALILCLDQLLSDKPFIDGVLAAVYPPASTGEIAQDALYPGIPDTYGPGETPPGEEGFVVEGPGRGQTVNLPSIPYVHYQSVDGELAADAVPAWDLMEGSFSEELTREDIQKIFWGAEGKPEGAEGDLPWMLFWGGYTLNGSALYDKGGSLLWLYLWGHSDEQGIFFTLTLRPGELPFQCCLYPDLETTDVFGTEVTGWSAWEDRDGDGTEETCLCASEFMAGDVGVFFETRACGGEDPFAAGSMQNSLLVRQALSQDGGLYLGHLMTAEEVPQWREAEFSSLEEARQEGDFVPWLPAEDFSGWDEFYGRLTYQEGNEHILHLRWSWGYDDVTIRVELPEGDTVWGNVVDVSAPETYDLRLYPIPRADSVPEEYRETVDNPVFRAEDMSREVVEARAYTPNEQGDTNSLRIGFSVLHPDGTLVDYSCEGLSVDQVWGLVQETLA